LHLSDDAGFRVESLRFPKLAGMGSDGMYYTQDEIRDFIAYAHARGIRVVPEFDMPGHSGSWFLGYPELASGPGPYVLGTADHPAMDPTKESTYKFLETFIGEMSKLFPDAYFHIGGDELNQSKEWDANPQIQAFMRAHGMKNDHDLQAYFTQRLHQILTRNHKITVGWDEILHPDKMLVGWEETLRPDLPKTIVVQVWRDQELLAIAAKHGYQGLLSAPYYLDSMWPAARHYAAGPMSGAAATLTPEEKARILGGESCEWTEQATPENIDSQIWPRNAVIAERLWSPPDLKDTASMYRRLNAVSLDLEWLGLTHRSARLRMLQRMAGATDVSALRVLADVVEPVKDDDTGDEPVKDDDPWPGYGAPLNRLVDAVYPESATARLFNNLVQAYVQSGAKDQAAESQIRSWLMLWRDNDAKLHPILVQSFLLQEDIALSQTLSAVAAAGLDALDYLDKSQSPPDAWRTQQLTLLKQAKGRSFAHLVLVVAAPVQQLIQAAAHW
jgi:hexosaminidase